ncbi:hypothetical protein LGH83_04680 [Lichenihabitans sp. PAMC28606]|uniref:hypothetical protein n=1 Tax=Lichenihabitans sp. PAMC28606 TaxID=2880932 RepID=UPI001D09B4D7|nr:hypothetical protein [Lichenihabitans sp. PAMC28606]UDL95523.1 hypothetical protein LGH83_04680 [Lichenihabitans sp. PAMC28606]
MAKITSKLLVLCMAAPFFVSSIAAIAADGVSIQITRDGFACRDISDTVRMGLRQLADDKAGFMEFYMDRQKTGACMPMGAGVVATLEDVRDEQELHLACIRLPSAPACVWALNPRFGEAPY